MMILFLDTEFTGLSHPANERKLLSLALLAEDGSAKWYAELGDWVLTDCELRSRLGGVTPEFQIGDADTSAVPATRYHDIQKYLADVGNRKCPRLALDDDPDFFPPRCAELVLRNGNHGFGEADERAFRSMLQARSKVNF